MQPMSAEQCRAFLSHGSRTAKLATVRKDGRPHVAPVWFLLDGEDLVFMTHEDSVKGRTLARNPQVMISVDEEVFPYGFVLVEGAATCSRPATAELSDWSRRIAERYVPEDMIESTAERNAVEGELLVRVRVTKLIGAAGVAA